MQIPDAALKSTDTRLFLHFARTQHCDVIHERGAKNAGDPFLGDEADHLCVAIPSSAEIKHD